MAIRVLIADDHALLRQGLKRVLNFEDDIEVVGETEDGQETLARTLVLQPDILLLDLNMPGLNGLDVASQLQAAKCNTKIIALTIHDNDNYVLEMLKNGASGYLLKDVEPDMLIKAIHIVYEGGAYIYPELEERIFGSLCVEDDINEKAKELWRTGRGERLTARELDVLSCIAKGFSNQDIAQALFVSEKTVKNHLTNIFRKLNVNDRTQALIYVLKHNIMKLD
ncbi:MAG: response regulator transcription factor [Anaerovibrio sp.]|jgi:DNA-binding NarL/FixJ family response regulator|uniref:Chemotaxis protein CheY n=2 Tax=Anaerovibrio lipolyticus TaxID=82374 RepID=A0A0B2K0K5_9FIRM|nr:MULTISPECIES: response regulator transcription factor [Anaerovibrio]KHM52488.1 chemotaxis protein CheY [Anaerovibrio lipolyticus]MBE6105774.1 response regulator transcription factor [Anaerovibrio lipolyticus]MBO5589094.1 response regulator transcription factor [Anaerovibrio sp.]MBO6245984.1 response regulator transcription factor [Anaerovibrio sp.]SHI28917.1 two component transcriptional regulator, LuxR family [Anaerovibrio lipolyticus DSM 3074]